MVDVIKKRDISFSHLRKSTSLLVGNHAVTPFESDKFLKPLPVQTTHMGCSNLIDG